jgi:putative transposase
MARLPRVVIVDVAHHVTQRGNARQVILASDADRVTYLELLREYSQLYALSLLGYCLMSNHVHLIAVPRTPQALSQSLKQAHGRYAAGGNMGTDGTYPDYFFPIRESQRQLQAIAVCRLGHRC